MHQHSDVQDMLRQSGAVKAGHFLLSSGKHTGLYVEKFDLLRLPAAASAACALIADRFRDQGIDVVAGPTTGGMILAFEVARQLSVGAAYAERASNGTGREFRRGTTFAAGARVLVVDDILTTGGSIQDTLHALEELRVVVAGIAVLVDRSDGSLDFGAPWLALATMDIETWEAASCPLCAVGMPLTKPGTTPTV